MIPHVRALECIRRMCGGSQSKLMRCSDGELYVVKFQNNPQGIRILANEVIAALLASILRLPVGQTAIVDVHRDLIRFTDKMIIEYPECRVPCRAGLCFGSLCETPPPFYRAVYDFLPEELFANVANVSDLPGILVFDKWTSNMDNRQLVFVPTDDQAGPYRQYRAVMVDNGHCFNGTKWNFPDAMRWGIYFQRSAYKTVNGLESMEPWLERLAAARLEDVLNRALEEIPSEWYRCNRKALCRLFAKLDTRRKCVGDLLIQTRRAYPELFPAWPLRSYSHVGARHGVEPRRIRSRALASRSVPPDPKRQASGGGAVIGADQLDALSYAHVVGRILHPLRDEQTGHDQVSVPRERVVSQAAPTGGPNQVTTLDAALKLASN